MPNINPYLTFASDTEAAFNFYKSVFGGEFLMLVRFKDMPSENLSPSEADKIMHVSLPIGKGTVLMGSDAPLFMGKLTNGNNFYISIDTESEAEATKLYNGLSAGGKITMPLGKAPWGAFFGMFEDKFGIRWMVNYDYNRPK